MPATATVADLAMASTVTIPRTTTTSHGAFAVKETTLTATGGTPAATGVTTQGPGHRLPLQMRTQNFAPEKGLPQVYTRVRD